MEDRENSKTRYIQEREEHDNLKTFVLGDLKKLGIKPPKVKRKVKDDNIVSRPTDQQSLTAWSSRFGSL